MRAKKAVIKMGADPEFIMESGEGTGMSACDFFGSPGSAGMGADGHSFTGEMRPLPAASSVELIANIAAIIKDTLVECPAIKDFTLLAGGYKHGRAIGGHIHISGVPRECHEEYNNLMERAIGIISDAIDDPVEKKERAGTGYGAGYRSQIDDRVEVRSPASWLLSPSVAYLHIYLAEAYAREYMDEERRGVLKAGASKVKTVADIIEVMKEIENVGKTEHMEMWLACVDDIIRNLPLPWNKDIKTLGWIE